MLSSAPSLSIYSRIDDDGVEELEKERSEPNSQSPSRDLKLSGEDLVRSYAARDSTNAVSSGEFCFAEHSEDLNLIDEEEEQQNGQASEEEGNGGLAAIQRMGVAENDESEPLSPPMHLAAGLGIEATGFGGGGSDFIVRGLYEGGDVEEYYQKMVEEFPNLPLFLRKYGQLLQSKGDLSGAERYYFQATLAEPNDAETLICYARLVWELHRDQVRALFYFEHAAEAAPHDSHVLAAYAKFLWEIEADKQENSGQQDDQFKGDIRGAEEYYLHNMLANPRDGENMSQYAKMVWEHQHDRDKALSVFEQAVQASPDDSFVLGAYASFLWETDEDDHTIEKNQI